VVLEAEFTSNRRVAVPMTAGTGWGLSFDYEADDAEWRAAVADTRFRQALSMALDRQRLVDLLAGKAEISSLAPSYDLQAARALLDESGHSPDVVLQPWFEWLMPGGYQDEIYQWLAQSWTALGLHVTLTGLGEQWTGGTAPRSYASLCLAPERATPYHVPFVFLPDALESFADAQAAWYGGYGSYNAYCDAVYDEQPFLPLIDGLQIPTNANKDLRGITADTLPDAWQQVWGWYWAEQ